MEALRVLGKSAIVATGAMAILPILPTVRDLVPVTFFFFLS